MNQRQDAKLRLDKSYRCEDCKYYHWYHVEGKPYGCRSAGSEVCGSFRKMEQESKK